MMDGTTAAAVTTDFGLTEPEFEAARADREGKIWFRDTIGSLDPTTEGTPIHHPPSATPISPAAFSLIVEFEVSSEAVYNAKYRGATWPGGSSGVTIGIGYDVGYVSAAQLREDWDKVISSPMLDALLGVIGITGAPADAAAAGLAGRVDIPFAAAIDVHRSKVIPRWTGLTEDSLANTSQLSPDSLGALVSLTYNRGAQYDLDTDRAREMRNIRDHMKARQFKLIPAEFRSMERLWPTVAGLRRRRELEAELFEHGLAAG